MLGYDVLSVLLQMSCLFFLTFIQFSPGLNIRIWLAWPPVDPGVRGDQGEAVTRLMVELGGREQTFLSNDRLFVSCHK